MFQKKFKQFMAATLSAAMIIGQVQYVNAAETDGNSIDFSEDFVEDYFEMDDVTEFTEESFEEEGDDEFFLEDLEEDAEFDTAFASAELPEGIVGMPEDYELTESELIIKADSIANKEKYNNEFASRTEGVDYAEKEVVFLSETKEHAEEVALAYAGSLKSFENGVAVIDLSESEASVEAAYSCAFIEDINLPVVTPNYFFGSAYAEVNDEQAEYDVVADEAATEASKEQDIELTSDYEAIEVSVADASEFVNEYADYFDSEFVNAVTATAAEAVVEEDAATPLAVVTASNAAEVMVELRTAVAGNAYVAGADVERFNIDPQLKNVIDEAYSIGASTANITSGEAVIDGNYAAAGKAKKVLVTDPDGGNKKKWKIGTCTSNLIKNQVRFSAKGDNGASVLWKIKSGAKKINISQSGNTVTITGVKTGTATLTATALDGSKKKATVTIKVINPVVGGATEFSGPLTSEQYNDRLANGGYYKIKSSVKGINGTKATKKKLKWVAVVAVQGADGATVLDAKKAKKVASASGGKITAKSGAWKWLKKNGYTAAAIHPYAYTTDGTGLVFDFKLTFSLVNGPKKPFGFPQGAGTFELRKSNYPYYYNMFEYTLSRGFRVISKTTTYVSSPTPFTVTSSNPSVLSVNCVWRNEAGAYVIEWKTVSKGTAKITVKTKDGTHLKSSSTWRVY